MAKMMGKREIRRELKETSEQIQNLPPISETRSATQHLEDYSYLTGYRTALKKVLGMIP